MSQVKVSGFGEEKGEQMTTESGDRDVEYIVDAFRSVARSLLKNPGLTRSEADIYGSDYRIIGYRLIRDPAIVRFDYKQFVRPAPAPTPGPNG